MHRTRSPRLFLLLLAGALVLAVFRVSSVPTAPTAPGTELTWRSALSEVGTEVQATVQGVRRYVLQQQATYSRMWQDTQVLEQRLTTVPQQ